MLQLQHYICMPYRVMIYQHCYVGCVNSVDNKKEALSWYNIDSCSCRLSWYRKPHHLKQGLEHVKPTNQLWDCNISSATAEEITASFVHRCSTSNLATRHPTWLLFFLGICSINNHYCVLLAIGGCWWLMVFTNQYKSVATHQPANFPTINIIKWILVTN